MGRNRRRLSNPLPEIDAIAQQAKQELDEYRSLIKARGKPMTKRDRQKLEAIIDKWMTVAFMAGFTWTKRQG